jgi:hypothetical protein
MLRFDHGMSRQGVGGHQDRSGWFIHRSEPIPDELAVAPAIYWLRNRGVCSVCDRASGTRTRWVTERNALTFQCTKNVIKSDSDGTSLRTSVGGG